MGWRALSAITALVIGAVWLVGDGTPGLAYLAIYALAAVPGLPLGFLLFGRDHPGGWIAGALIGYVLTAFAIWIPIAAGRPSALTFEAVWLLLCVSTWMLWRRVRMAAVELPHWQPGASAGLVLVIFLTFAIAVPPFQRVGSRDAEGNRYYRAYFTADFVWHTALTAELAKFTMPPRNPYLASQPIHYYWTYFLLPSAVSQTGPAPVRDVQRCLKVNALLTGALLMAAVFMAAWAALASPLLVTVATCFVLVAASAEGLYELHWLWTRDRPLAAVRDLNIDAMTAWRFQGHRIDGLPRCLWYVPQHSMAYALGLVALAAGAAVGSAGRLTAIVLAGLALGCATAINPLVGAVFAVAWGVGVVLDAVRRPAPLVRVALHASAAIPVGLAVLWCVLARMVDGAGGAVEFGLGGASLRSPFFSLLLSLGPVLLPAAAGLLPASRVRFIRVAPMAVLVALSLFLMFWVRLRVDHEWVPFRAGQMLLVAAPALVGRWLSVMSAGPISRRTSIAAVIVLAAIGLPTTVIDAYNARDIANRNAGPGFRWTMVLSRDEQQVMNWIRRVTPPTAVVQMEPVVRERDAWSQIPSFGERRMAAGLPISLLRIPEYREKSGEVQKLYATGDAREAWEIARSLRIRYIYVDSIDRAAYDGVRKFDRSPEYFAPAFRRGVVAVYEVR